MTGIVFGAFDFLHAGHVHFLRECKKQCSHLIVGLQVNPQLERPDKHKPKEGVFERFVKLQNSRLVDEIIVYETEKDLINILKYCKPDVRFLGSDYGDKPITEPDLVPIQYIESLDIHSSDYHDNH